MGAQLRDVPALAPEQAQFGRGRNDGVALAGEGFNQRRFSAAVRAKDGRVFAVLDAQREIVEDDVVAARNRDVAHEEEIGIGSTVQEEIIADAGLVQ